MLLRNAMKCVIWALTLHLHDTTRHDMTSAHSPLGLFSDQLHQVLRSFMLLTLPILFIFYNNWNITFLISVFILTHPANLPCRRKPDNSEKTHDFRLQSVHWLFSHESIARIEPTISEVKGACSEIVGSFLPTNSYEKSLFCRKSRVFSGRSGFLPCREVDCWK